MRAQDATAFSQRLWFAWSFDSAATAEELERQFDADLKHSRRIDPEEWEKRSVWHRLAEESCRLMAPVL